MHLILVHLFPRNWRSAFCYFNGKFNIFDYILLNKTCQSYSWVTLSNINFLWYFTCDEVYIFQGLLNKKNVPVLTLKKYSKQEFDFNGSSNTLKGKHSGRFYSYLCLMLMIFHDTVPFKTNCVISYWINYKLYVNQLWFIVVFNCSVIVILLFWVGLMLLFNMNSL